MNDQTCPCGSTENYMACCGQYIENKQPAPTPLALMRSRYSAFALGNVDYIAKTMQGAALKNFDASETSSWLKQVSWDKLKVINSKIKTPKLGFVSFEAHYIQGNQKHVIREKSEFHKIGNEWFYIKGKTLNPRLASTTQPEQNAPCPCQSGKKYKHCCGKGD